MVRCHNCKHWDPPNYPPAAGEQPGRCMLADYDSGAEHPQSLAWAEDSDCYRAWLRTLPLFGCVQGEPR